jgi:hypothetical protein
VQASEDMAAAPGRNRGGYSKLARVNMRIEPPAQEGL